MARMETDCDTDFFEKKKSQDGSLSKIQVWVENR